MPQTLPGNQITQAHLRQLQARKVAQELFGVVGGTWLQGNGQRRDGQFMLKSLAAPETFKQGRNKPAHRVLRDRALGESLPQVSNFSGSGKESPKGSRGG